MKKILSIVFSVLLVSFIVVPQTHAADLTIDCPGSSTSCNTSGLDPLFSTILDGFWYPGKSITKTINLKNSGPDTQAMALKGTRASTVSILENVMQISIVGGNTVIWNGSVADFYRQEKIGMGIFAPGADLDYTFTVFMSHDADNMYQNQGTVFNLMLGFWEEPLLTPTPTLAANFSNAGSGGSVLGTSISAPVCDDTKPAGVPKLLSAVAGTNSVTLTWSEGTGPVTYYLVTYGSAPGLQQFGNPNVGGAGTTSYTVGGLSGGIAYYFQVRAGNGCMPGDFSNELSTTPGGGFISGPAAGFIPGVLGANTVAAPSATPPPQTGEVLAEHAPGSPWWSWIVNLFTFIAQLFHLQ